MTKSGRKLRLAVLISGGGTNLQAMIERSAVGKLNAEVVVVLSDRPGAFGLDRAARANIPAFHVDYKAFSNYTSAELERVELPVDLADLDLKEVAEHGDGERGEARHQPEGATPHVRALADEPTAGRPRRGRRGAVEGGAVAADAGGARGLFPLAAAHGGVGVRPGGATPHPGPPKTPERVEPSSPSVDSPLCSGGAASSVAGALTTWAAGATA